LCSYFVATTERFYAEGPTEDPTETTQPLGRCRSFASDVTVRLTHAAEGRVARPMTAQREAMKLVRPMAESQASGVRRRLKRPARLAQQRL
jgi:hypothetical protein